MNKFIIVVVMSFAFPVVAQSQPHRHATAITHARPPVTNITSVATVGGSQIGLNDCIHVAFPQCDGNATQTQGSGTR
jgi:hypothetical protein